MWYGYALHVGAGSNWPNGTTKLIETGWDINGMSGDCVSIYTPGSVNGTSKINISSSGTINFDGTVGIGTKSPSATLHVNGSIKHLGGYAVFGLSSNTYANGTSTLQFGNTLFSSRITNNTSSFVIQDAGVYMIHLKLNSDTTVTSNLLLTLEYWNGSSWSAYQRSEDSGSFNNQTEYSTHFMIEGFSNMECRVTINNQSGSNWGFSTDQANGTWWSRLMIYKVA